MTSGNSDMFFIHVPISSVVSHLKLHGVLHTESTFRCIFFPPTRMYEADLSPLIEVCVSRCVGNLRSTPSRPFQDQIGGQPQEDFIVNINTIA